MLTVEGLEPCAHVTHGFSTDRLGDMRRLRDDPDPVRTAPRRAFANELGLDPGRMTVIGAVHGTAIARVDEPMGLVEGVDGLITDRPGLPLLGTFADCRPLILHDPVRGAVALCHAGWRGTAANMAGAGVAALRDAYGSRPEDLVVGIGPGICADCYEVGPEVAARFPDGCSTPGRDDRLMLDVAAATRHQLREAGVRPGAVHVHPACTMESPRLASHRRRPDGTRFAGLVALR